MGGEKKCPAAGLGPATFVAKTWPGTPTGRRTPQKKRLEHRCSSLPALFLRSVFKNLDKKRVLGPKKAVLDSELILDLFIYFRFIHKKSADFKCVFSIFHCFGANFKIIIIIFWRD